MTSEVTEQSPGDQVERWMEHLPSGVISQTQLKDLLIPGKYLRIMCKSYEITVSYVIFKSKCL